MRCGNFAAPPTGQGCPPPGCPEPPRRPAAHHHQPQPTRGPCRCVLVCTFSTSPIATGSPSSWCPPPALHSHSDLSVSRERVVVKGAGAKLAHAYSYGLHLRLSRSRTSSESPLTLLTIATSPLRRGQGWAYDTQPSLNGSLSYTTPALINRYPPPRPPALPLP